jgi:3-methyladenine DNA glycosylase AlkC
MDVKTRIFLVGCPRSGTTLLQSMLASHSDVVSFPESHFFTRMTLHRTPIERILGLASSNTHERLHQFLIETEREDLKYLYDNKLPTMQRCSSRFINILDRMADDKRAKNWLEKTPDNILDTILKYVPKSKVIHIVRNGADAVASLHEVSNKYKEHWSGGWTIDKCVDHWLRCINATYRFINEEEQHFIVNYEHLVEEPAPILKEMCRFLGITYQTDMLAERDAAASEITLASEEWKNNVSTKAQKLEHRKFDKIFSDLEQEYI